MRGQHGLFLFCVHREYLDSLGPIIGYILNFLVRCSIIMKKGLWGALMKNESVQAVHDDDLFSLLKSLGFLEKVVNGDCKCAFCEQIITIDNLGSILPRGDEIAFSCDSPECIRKISRLGEVE